MLNMVAGFSQVHSLYAKGLLEKPNFDASERTFITTIKSPGALQWWKHFKHLPPEPLVDYINKSVNDPTITVGPAHHDLPWLWIEE